jgi:hypothetical protein
MVPAHRAELVIAERVLARQEPESLWFYDGAPVARLRADRAITLARALGEIDIRLVANGAAVATTPIGLLHRRGS